LDDDSYYLDELNELNVVAHSSVNLEASPISRDNSTARGSTKPIEKEKLAENPEMVAMFENKMWDGFKIILDKCVISETEYDFTKMDMNVFSTDKHPLMFIARSGQEALLKHDTVSVLLDLKWKLMPRFAFYFNILFYLTFLLLLSLYSLELSEYGSDWNDTDSTVIVKSGNVTLYLPDDVDFFDLPYATNNWATLMLLILIICLNVTKELFQFLVIEGLAYFVSMQNLIELVTYVLTLMSILSDYYPTKCSYGSVAVLFAFLVFPLYIQKVKIFGVYVVAFCRTLKNSNIFFQAFFF
jgi:hypothetical protein